MKKGVYNVKHEQTEIEIARRSALIYVPISLGVALLFLLMASLTSDHPLMARLGGTVWVGLLSLIVSMPLVTARIKRQLRGG
jgi:hypothetical protein